MEEEFVSAGAARTARWRAGLKDRKLPETDDVDTVLATAFASFVGQYHQSRGHRGPFLTLISDALRAAGFNIQEGFRRAEARLYYLEMTGRHPDASAAQKRRWELGRPAFDPSFIDEPETDPDKLDDGYFDPANEVGLEEAENE